jgi:hypothetical protein
VTADINIVSELSLKFVQTVSIVDSHWSMLRSSQLSFPEPVFKTKKCGNESTLFSHFHKHSFVGLGIYTDFLRVDSIFWGGGGDRGAFGFSKAEFRFPIILVEPLV